MNLLRMLLCSTMAVVPALSVADTVRLFSVDSNLDIQGKLIDFDGEKYVIRTSLGDLNVAADLVKCEGADCPTNTTNETVVLRGSSTIGETLIPLLVEGFAIEKNAAVDLKPKSSGNEIIASISSNAGFGDEIGSYLVHSSATVDAFTALQYQTAQIGMASRRINRDEARALRQSDAGNMISASQEHIFALDSMLVVVHPENPISSLSLAQIRGIFTGSIKNWSQLGGENIPIVVVDREGWSATRKTFSTAIFDDAEALKGLKTSIVVEDGEQTAATVTEEKGAIGFLSHADKRATKALTLISDCGLAMSPDAFSARTEEYGLLQRLYLYNRQDGHNAASAEFLSYALSEAADPIIRKAGFFDLEIQVKEQTLDGSRATQLTDPRADVYERQFMNQMLAQMVDYDRLSTTFRFQTGSSRIDERGQNDMARLAKFLESSPEGTEVLFVGFTDNVGKFDANLALSLERADAVLSEMRSLVDDDLPQITWSSTGYGEIAPLQCNDKNKGRRINRRVEIWLKPPQ